jgi:chemotaxis-related protein WspD
MRTDLLAADPGEANSGKLDDCWNKIGVWGNGECSQLKKVVHCRNCAIYSSAAARLLEKKELPQGYLDRWTRHFATEVEVENHQSQSALIFRIGAEWLALSPFSLEAIVEDRRIHSLPHFRSKTLLGLANIRGELLICVTLDELLGLEKKQPAKSGHKRRNYRRLVVANREGSRFVFPVDEVHGIHRFNPKVLKAVPCTLGQARTAYVRGILLWEDKSVGCLDDQLLFYMLDRSLT